MANTIDGLISIVAGICMLMLAIGIIPFPANVDPNDNWIARNKTLFISMCVGVILFGVLRITILR